LAHLVLPIKQPCSPFRTKTDFHFSYGVGFRLNNQLLLPAVQNTAASLNRQDTVTIGVIAWLTNGTYNQHPFNST
jgi:hypothetical protein